MAETETSRCDEDDDAWPLTRAQPTHMHREGQNQGKDYKGVLESSLLFYQQHGPQPS